jgi:hypothetical protein
MEGSGDSVLFDGQPYPFCVTQPSIEIISAPPLAEQYAHVIAACLGRGQSTLLRICAQRKLGRHPSRIGSADLEGLADLPYHLWFINSL